MKKVMDKLLNNIKFDKKYVLFSIILVILGILTGSIFITILNYTDKSIVIEYIESFINSINENKVNLNNFYNNIINNVIVITIITIIGFTYFLIPINLLVLFYKSFVIGFSLSSFILTYKIKGLIFSIFYIFPHMIINILLFSLLTSFTLKLSINMIKYIIKGKSINLKNYFNRYFSIFIFSIIIIFITTLYETYIIPYILKFIIKILI